MKYFLVLTMTLLTLTHSNTTFAKNGETRMREFSQLNGIHTFVRKKVEELGFQAKKIDIDTSLFPYSFIQLLKKREYRQRKLWKNYILHDDVEWGGYSKKERLEIALNPQRELNKKYIAELDLMVEIYKNGKLIGYAIEIYEHAQAAIYQDGAWETILVDTKFNIIDSQRDSA